MDNRLRFLYPYICEGMTERGSCSQRLEELVQARYRDGRQIHHPKREGVKRTESYGEYGRQWRNFQEKFLTLSIYGPYRKWTHMGEERILR